MALTSSFVVSTGLDSIIFLRLLAQNTYQFLIQTFERLDMWHIRQIFRQHRASAEMTAQGRAEL